MVKTEQMKTRLKQCCIPCSSAIMTLPSITWPAENGELGLVYHRHNPPLYRKHLQIKDPHHAKKPCPLLATVIWQEVEKPEFPHHQVPHNLPCSFPLTQLACIPLPFSILFSFQTISNLGNVTFSSISHVFDL